jgi:general secretion pathway protein A
VQVAGGNARPSFNRWALRSIYRYSHGVPRLINAVCDKTLKCGYVLGTDRLLGRHVRRAVRELEGLTG